MLLWHSFLIIIIIILPVQTKSFHILLDTIPSCLSLMSLWFGSFHFHFHSSIQSLSSLCSTCPNHLNLSFLIIKLTGADLNTSLNSAFSFLYFDLNSHIHLSMVILVLSNLNFMFHCQWPGLAAMYQTTPHT